MALNEFEGTVMLVSHDRAMLREVCDEFWLVTRGGVSPFDGDLDDYQKWLLEVSRAAAKGQEPPPVPGGYPAVTPAPTATPPTAAPAPRSAARDDRKQGAQTRSQIANRTRPMRSELQQIDSRLAKLGSERTALEGQLATPGLRGSVMAEAGRQLNHAVAEIGQLEERWLELQGEIEAITSSSASAATNTNTNTRISATTSTS